MSVQTILKDDMKASMKSGDKATLQTVRQLLAAIQRKTQDEKDDAIKKGRVFEELNEDQMIQVLQTYKKQCEESLDAFQKRGDQDKVRELELEIAIITRYLPQQMGKEEIKKVIASTTLDMSNLNKGTLMKAIMPILKGKADNKTIGEAVDEWLKA